METNENQVPDWQSSLLLYAFYLIPLGMVCGVYYLGIALWKHWEIFVALLYAAVSFFVVHWFSILAILALWEIVRLLRVIANTHGVIGQILAKQAERDEDAADERSSYRH